jgi:hypothetical protein
MYSEFITCCGELEEAIGVGGEEKEITSDVSYWAASTEKREEGQEGREMGIRRVS